ncbi:MAG: hypothetical protein HYY30_07500 [Chloroflexi bacterium]|nr:hypothetical protein [Chloroflexota bacterium]
MVYLLRKDIFCDLTPEEIVKIERNATMSTFVLPAELFPGKSAGLFVDKVMG